MSEIENPAQEHANRLIEYCLKAKAAVTIHDTELEPIIKAEQQQKTVVDPFDLAAERHFNANFNDSNFRAKAVEVTEQPQQTEDPFDVAVKRKLKRL